MEGTDTAPATVSSAPSTGTSPAAPATSAPSSPISPEQRPTFAQAFASDTAPASDPSTSTESPTTQASAEPPDPTASTPSTEGPIPFQVHKTALDNARAKERLAATQDFDRDFGWAKQVPRASLERFGQIASQMSTDPIGFLNTFVAELQANPTHGPALRSQAGRLLASARGQGADAMPAPDVQITDAQGNVTGQTYSDKALAERDAWSRRQIMADINKQLQPIQQEREQKQAEARQAEISKQVHANADGVFADIADVLEIPADKPNELFLKVHELIQKDPTLSPHRAAIQVRKQYVDPHRAGTAQRQVLDDLKTKAAAQGVNPASASASTTHKPTSFHDKSLTW